MTYRPTVYLSICYTIANIALNFALGQAITVAWWVKALHPGVTVKDLHHIWSYGTNLADILLAGRRFNLVALASLLVTIAPINGPLLQRASVLHEQTKIEYKNISIPVAQYMLPGYTGWYFGRSLDATIITDDFGNIINEYTNKKDIIISNSGCLGICKGHLLGAGYAVSCNDDTVPFNVSYSDTDDGMILQSARMFSTGFEFDKGNEGNFSFTALFLNSTFRDTVGFVNRTKCILQPATIDYPIIFTNNSVSLDPSGSWLTDRVDSLRVQPWYWDIGVTSTHGGLALYFQSAFASEADMWMDPVKGMQLEINGSTIFGYIQGADARYYSTSGVITTITFQSPTFDVLNIVREIAFRTAIRMPTTSDTSPYFNMSGAVNQTEQDAWHAATAQIIPVEQTGTEVVYKSQYLFLIIAIVFTFLATFSVLIIFNGWWYLSRKVSLSPIEVARAFAAPSLIHSDPNAEIKMLLKQVGDVEVGFPAPTDERGEYGPVTTLRFDGADKSERPVARARV
jgi:hypothetical protein